MKVEKKIRGSICLSDLNEEKIELGKNGKKYYPVEIAIFDEENKFGKDVSITTAQSKEERTSKLKFHHVGNGQVLFKNKTKKEDSEPAPANDDLPF